VAARLLPLALSGLALIAAAPAHGLSPTITTYPSSDPPSGDSHPYAIAAGRDGALWFTDPYAHDIGRMTVAGTLTLQAPVPASSFPEGIAAGSDGAMWFVSQSPSTVSRVDASGVVQSKPLMNPSTNPTHIVGGPDGALWFTETAALGRIPATSPPATPDESRATLSTGNAIATGSDGNLWFTRYVADAIGRMTTTGVEKDFPLPTGFANPEGIAAGPDGALWYTTLNPGAVVRIGTDGVQKPYPLPPGASPDEIAPGPDGALWFSAGRSIGRISTGGAIETFTLPPDVGLNYIVGGPDGNVWFTEENAGRIGRITTPPNATTGAPGAVGGTGASVNGTVNGHSQPTSVTIEYGPAGGPTTSSAAQRLDASPADQPVTIALSKLRPLTPYRYRVVANNGTGITTGAFQTFTTTAARLDLITNLVLEPSLITAARSGPSVTAARRAKPGAIVTYAGTQEATTTFTVQRPVAGRRQGRRCVKPTRRTKAGRRCTRYRPVGSFTHDDTVGENSFRFSGRVKGRTLRPGRYRLRAIPNNAAGDGRTTVRRFRVKG
jgi:virginiamycin B lyase